MIVRSTPNTGGGKDCDGAGSCVKMNVCVCVSLVLCWAEAGTQAGQLGVWCVRVCMWCVCVCACVCTCVHMHVHVCACVCMCCVCVCTREVQGRHACLHFLNLC